MATITLFLYIDVYCTTMPALHYRKMKNSSLGQVIGQIQSRAVPVCLVRGPPMLLEQEVFHTVNLANSKNPDGEVWGSLLALKRILGLSQHRLGHGAEADLVFESFLCLELGRPSANLPFPGSAWVLELGKEVDCTQGLALPFSKAPYLY